MKGVCTESACGTGSKLYKRVLLNLILLNNFIGRIFGRLS